MDACGWQVNRNQHPAGLHAMVTAQHLQVVDQYLEDLFSIEYISRLWGTSSQEAWPEKVVL